MAALEQLVGRSLFDRKKRPVQPTEAGRALAVQARHVLRALEEAEAAMAPWRGGTRGIVCLGSYPSAGAAFVPGLLKGLADSEPDLRVVVSEHATLELDEALASGEVDLYLRPMSPGPASASVASLPLWREPLVVVHADDHPLGTVPDPVPLAAVVEHPVVSTGRMGVSEPVVSEAQQLFQEHGTAFEPVQATNHPQTLVSLVAQGIGVGVTNGLAVWTADTTGVRVRPLEGAFERWVAVCWDSTRPLTPAARSTLKAIVESDIPEGTIRIPQDRHKREAPVLGPRILV